MCDKPLLICGYVFVLICTILVVLVFVQHRIAGRRLRPAPPFNISSYLQNNTTLRITEITPRMLHFTIENESEKYVNIIAFPSLEVYRADGWRELPFTYVRALWAAPPIPPMSYFTLSLSLWDYRSHLNTGELYRVRQTIHPMTGPYWWRRVIQNEAHDLVAEFYWER